MEAVRRRGFLGGLRILGDGEDGDAGAEEFEEFTASQFEMVDGTGGEFVAFRFKGEVLRLVARRSHRARSCMALAACCTASTMRGCVPQRQMFPCKN